MKIGVCTRIKDEQRIIREWVKHYLRLGFDRIVIYDDGSVPPVRETLSDCPNNGVIIIDDPTVNQGEAYKDGLCRCKDLDWLLFCDADEFLWTDGRNVKMYLGTVPDSVGTILIHWLVYGTSGIERMHPSIPIFQQFLHREPYTHHLNGYVKSFVRPAMNNLHIWVHISYSPHKQIALANGRSVTNRDCLLATEYRTPSDLQTMPLLLIHYMTLDFETMNKKRIRNTALVPTLGIKYSLMWYNKMFSESIIDRRMIKYS